MYLYYLWKRGSLIEEGFYSNVKYMTCWVWKEIKLVKENNGSFGKKTKFIKENSVLKCLVWLDKWK